MENKEILDFYKDIFTYQSQNFGILKKSTDVLT